MIIVDRGGTAGPNIILNSMWGGSCGPQNTRDVESLCNRGSTDGLEDAWSETERLLNIIFKVWVGAGTLFTAGSITSGAGDMFDIVGNVGGETSAP